MGFLELAPFRFSDGVFSCPVLSFLTGHNAFLREKMEKDNETVVKKPSYGQIDFGKVIKDA